MSVYRVSSNKSSVNNFPTVRPTLDLDFANSKTLDPRITFTRSSGGSYVGADGLIKLAGVNEARFDHDPYTGESLGLLVEEARTNLFEWSETFVSGWNGFGSGEAATQVNVDTIFNPFGVLGTVYYITKNEWVRNFNANGLSTLALSFFSKRRFGGLNRDFSTIEIFQQAVGGGSLGIYNFRFDGNNPNSGQFQNIRTERYQNDWYRFSCTLVAIPGYNGGVFATNARVDLEGGAADNYFWGIQVESGAFATSYIPTIGSTRTRAADNASITGKNFSDFYRPDEGTIYSSFYPNTISTSSLGHFVFAFTDGTSSGTTQNTLNLLKRGNIDFSTRFSSASSSGPNNSFINVGTWSTNKTNISSSYKENNFAAVKNGSTVLNNNLVNTPVNINIFHIGSRFEQSYLNGTIARLTYYPKRLPDAQLQALTK